MKFQTTITFKQGIKTVAEIEGIHTDTMITLSEAAETVIQTEQFLERLTGLRVHICITAKP